MILKSVPSLRILTASAGSGKTFALTLHYLGLILRSPKQYRSILALTFTNKATAEMKGRILKVLKELANARANQDVSKFLEQLQIDFPTWTTEEIFNRAKEAYRQLLHDYSHFYVQTIDGFSQQVIRSFTYELGLDAGYRVEMNLGKVKNDLTQRLYASLNENDELKSWMLDHMFEQLEIGKDWNLNRKLHSLAQMIFSESFKDFDDWVSLEQNVEIFDITWELAKVKEVSFEEDYLRRVFEIADHIKRLGIDAADLYYTKSHPLLKFLVIESDDLHVDYLYERIPKLIDNIDAYQTEKKRKPHVDTLFEAINPLLVGWLNFMDTQFADYKLAKALKTELRFLRILKDMSGLLAEWRTDEQAQLISDAQKLLEKIGQTPNGDPTFIWEKMGNRFRYFLFDEFQDTSHAQWSNLFPLMLNAMGQGNQSYFQHLVVGDVKQSIYRWRNGDFRILLQGIENDVKRSFHVTDTKEFIHKSSLEKNFRSQPTIVNFNNTLYRLLPKYIQSLVNEEALDMLGNMDMQFFWEKNKFDDLIQRAYADQKQEVPVSKQAKDFGRVQLYGIHTKNESSVLETEEKLNFKTLAFHKSYEVLKDWIFEQKIAPGEIGVLTRTKKEAREMVDFIRQKQGEDRLQFSINSGDALFLNSHPAILTIIFTLRSLAYPDHSYRIYLGQALFHFGQYQKKAIPQEAWLVVGNQSIHQLKDWLPEGITQNWEALGLLPLGTLVERLIQDYKFDEDSELTGFLLAFRDFVEKYHSFGFAGLQRFLIYWDEEGQDLTLPGEQQSNAIQVMTIHKSKGLDFRAVLVPLASWEFRPKWDERIWIDLENTPFSALGKVPLSLHQIKESSVVPQVCEEYLYSALDSLNNLYVATTRAVEELYVIFEEVPDTSKISELNLGRLLKRVLIDEYSDKILSEPLYLVEQGADFGSNVQVSITEKNEFILDHYPSANIMKNLVRKVSIPILDSGPNLEARRFGNVLHQIMAKMSSVHQLDELLDQLEATGKIHADKRSWLKGLILQAWQHPVLGHWLKSELPQANEMAMVDLQGKTFRPDKIIFDGQETIIIDFKLASQKDNSLYILQLERYLGFLKSMGYPGVRGFIYYFLQNELQEI